MAASVHKNEASKTGQNCNTQLIGRFGPMRLSKAIATGKTKLIIKEGQHLLQYGQRALPLTEKQFKKLKNEKKYGNH